MLILIGIIRKLKQLIATVLSGLLVVATAIVMPFDVSAAVDLIVDEEQATFVGSWTNCCVLMI